MPVVQDRRIGLFYESENEPQFAKFGDYLLKVKRQYEELSKEIK